MTNWLWNKEKGIWGWACSDGDMVTAETQEENDIFTERAELRLGLILGPDGFAVKPLVRKVGFR